MDNTGSRNSDRINENVLAQRFGFADKAYYGAIRNQNESDKGEYGVGTSPAHHGSVVLKTNQNGAESTWLSVHQKTNKQSIAREIEILKMKIERETELHRIEMEILERRRKELLRKANDSSIRIHGKTGVQKLDTKPLGNYTNEWIQELSESNGEQIAIVEQEIRAECAQEAVVLAESATATDCINKQQKMVHCYWDLPLPISIQVQNQEWVRICDLYLKQKRIKRPIEIVGGIRPLERSHNVTNLKVVDFTELHDSHCKHNRIRNERAVTALPHIRWYAVAIVNDIKSFGQPKVKMKRSKFLGGLENVTVETQESAYGQSIDVINADQKTYYYTMDWRDSVVDSSLFYMRSGHENPKEFPIKNRLQTASHVLIGGFEMGAAAKAEINNYIEITSDTRPDDPSIKLHSSLYYHCNDVFNPEVGDIRLQFLTAGVEGNFYTIVAKYENGLLVPYITSINTTVLILIPGHHSVEEAFDAAHYERKLHAWALRFIGLVLLFFSITCLSESLTVVLADIRLFALILPNPSQPIYGNLLLAFSMGFIIIAFSWLLFRPWLALGMFLAATSPFMFCTRNIVPVYHRIGTRMN